MTIIEIPLSNSEIRKAIVDEVDTDVLLQKWHVANFQTGKSKVAYKSGRNAYLGRVILTRIIGRPLAPFEYVGYWNGNTFDNRRKNLFVADINQINHRRRLFDNNEVGFKGVTKMKYNGKYRARIYVNGKAIYLGEYQYAEHAYAAYCRAATTYYGELARLD